jgi:hypothetical protein
VDAAGEAVIGGAADCGPRALAWVPVVEGVGDWCRLDLPLGGSGFFSGSAVFFGAGGGGTSSSKASKGLTKVKMDFLGGSGGGDDEVAARSFNG